MPKMSREKGKRGEREAAELLRRYGFQAKRSAQHKGNVEAEDGDLTHSMEGFHIEVKRTETLGLYDALDQAKADAAPGNMPVVMHRKNGRRWVVIVDAEDWLAERNRYIFEPAPPALREVA